MSQFDATARIRVDLSAFTRAAQQAGRDTGAWTAAMRQLENSLVSVQRRNKQEAAQISNTLKLYQQLAGAVNSYASSIQRLSALTQSNVRASQVFGRALGQLRASLAGVQPLSQKEADRLNRTLVLYERLAKAVSTYARALETMARLNQRAQQAQAAANREKERAARAAQQVAKNTQAANVATISFTSSNFALRSALTDVQAVYKSIVDTLVAIPKAAAQAAISQEAAFAHVERVTQQTKLELEGLRLELRRMSEEIPIPFENLARIAVLGGQIGLARDELAAFTEVIAQFAATTDVAEEEATLLLGRIAQMSNVPIREMANLGSAISELGSNSAATEGEIARTVESIATVSRQAGLAATTTFGLGAAMASLRIRPELARGAMTRVFNSLAVAVDEAGDKTLALGHLMNLTAEELREMQRQEPDKFFLRFLEALQGVDEAGQSVQTTLRGIGIINTRDIDATARLAGNYELVARSVDLANESFQEGTFLQRESEKIFQTTQAQIQRTANTIKNLMADIGVAFLPAINSVATAIRGIVDAIRRVPAGTQILALLAAFSVSAAAVIAFRVAIAGAMAAVVAFRQVMAQTQNQGVSFRALIQLLSQNQQQLAASTATATAAQRGQATAMTQTAAAAGTAAAATTGAAVATTRFATVMRVATLGLGPFGLALTALSTAAIFLAPRFFESSEAAKSLSDSVIEATGGAQALQDALKADTEAAAAGTRAFRTVTKEVENFTGAEREAADEARRRATAQRGVIEATVQSDAAISKLNREIEKNTVVTQRGTAAIGKQTAELLEARISTVLMESALVDSDAALQSFINSGLDMGRVMGSALLRPEAAIKALDTAFDNLTIRQNEARVSAQGFVTTAERVRFIGPAAEEAGGVILELKDVIEDYVEEANRAAIVNAALDGSLALLSEEALSNATSFEDLGESLEDVVDAAKEAQEQFTSVHETLQGFGGPLDAWTNGLQRANEAAQKTFTDAGESHRNFTELTKISFSDYLKELDRIIEAQRNWAQNIVELSARLPPDVASELAALGPEAAPMIQMFVDQTDEELAKLIPRWRATSEEGTAEIADVIAEAIPVMGQLSGDLGTQIAQMLAQEMESAGVEDIGKVISTFGSLIMELDELEAVPEVHLDDLAAQETLSDLLSKIQGINAAGDLDPEAEAELDPTPWQSELEFLERSANNATNRNTIGVESNAKIDSTRYNTEITKLIRAALTAGINIEKELTRKPTVDRTNFNSALNTMTSSAQRIGNAIERALTRTARITVTTHVRPGAGVHDQRALADGGWVSGPGGPREDRIPAWLSAGEFVVNARAASRFSTVLEQINSFRGVGGRPLDPGIDLSNIHAVRPPSHSGTTATRSPVQIPERARMLGEQRPATQPRMMITIHNTYPRSEPTSTTINRSLAFAAALDGAG